jgi:hypothetical protein
MKNGRTMTNFLSLAATSLLASLAVGCVTETGTDAPLPADDAVPPVWEDTGAPVPSFRPATCQEIVDRTADAADGEYVLFIHGQADLRWKAFCADMQTAPREYLTLERGAGKNTAMYAAGGVSTGTSVVTIYERVRVDPKSLAIDIGDTTFARSTGSLKHKGGIEVTDAPFGVAYVCSGTATANIDLTGTPFHPEDPFKKIGNVTAKYSVSTDTKAITTTVDGTDCGYTSPEAPLPNLDPIDDTDHFVLRLSYRP